jgi:hypothetical protein
MIQRTYLPGLLEGLGTGISWDLDLEVGQGHALEGHHLPHHAGDLGGAVHEGLKREHQVGKDA